MLTDAERIDKAESRLQYLEKADVRGAHEQLERGESIEKVLARMEDWNYEAMRCARADSVASRRYEHQGY